MRVAMIGHKRIPGREGGIEVVVEELSTRMVQYGNDVTVYNRKSKRTKPVSAYNGVQIITVPTIEKKQFDAIVYAFFSSCHALLRHYDVVHFHAIGPSLFLIIPHLFGIRTVVTVHGLNYKSPKWNGLGAKAMKWGERIAAKYADEVIVLSKKQQEYFKKIYGRKTNFIPNGTTIKPVCSPNIIKKKYGLEGKKYILFISRLVPGKGLEYLIDAYKQIKGSLPLIIAGDAPFSDEFINEVKRKAALDKRIRFIGFVNGEELQELYSNTRLFVFPSEAEGMPMCLLEAMSYNAPCLVSDISENTEVGSEYIWTFHTKDVVDLKNKMERLLNNPIDEKKIEGERKYIKDNYDWDKVVEKTMDIYRG